MRRRNFRFQFAPGLDGDGRSAVIGDRKRSSRGVSVCCLRTVRLSMVFLKGRGFFPLSPEYRGEGLGVRGNRPPLTPSPKYQGRGELYEQGLTFPHEITLGMGMLEFQSIAGTRQVGMQRSPFSAVWGRRRKTAVRSDVIVEVFQVAERQGAEQATCLWIAGAVCADSGMAKAGENAAACRKPVMPRQRVASAWSTSTASASSIRRK